jgi:hypothetical protein
MPHPSLKYAIQFVLMHTAQNLLQAPKKLVLVSQLNPPQRRYRVSVRRSLSEQLSGHYSSA